MDDNQVQRIIAEETFRAKIHDELFPPSPAESKFHKLLNSPLGLLLVSSVAIGGFGKLYADNRERVEKENTARQEVLKLTAEFNHRYQYAADLVRKLKAAQGKADEVQSISILLWRVIVGDKAFMPALPEYKENHWGGILARMEALGVSASTEVEGAIYDLDFANKNWSFDIERASRDLDTIDAYRKKLKK
jgi:hypothetical protein